MPSSAHMMMLSSPSGRHSKYANDSNDASNVCPTLPCAALEKLEARESLRAFAHCTPYILGQFSAASGEYARTCSKTIPELSSVSRKSVESIDCART
jgi:hypothetical protein